MKNLLIAFCCIATLSACNNSQKKEEALKEIETKSESFYATLEGSNFDMDQVQELINLQESFFENYPNDTAIAKMKLDVAGLYINFLGETEKGLEAYLYVFNHFPESEYAINALFAAATIYSDHLKDFDKAREYYNLLIENYPDNVLAKDAQILVDNLGLTPDQLFEKIMKEHAETSEKMIE